MTLTNIPLTLNQQTTVCFDFEKDTEALTQRLEDMQDFLYVQKIAKKKERKYQNEKTCDELLARYA